MDLRSLEGIDLDKVLARAKEADKLNPRAQRFEELISEIKSNEGPFSDCVRYLEELSARNELQFFYFGGFLRDLWIGMVPKDIDVVYHKTSQNFLMSLINDKIVRKNRFGGLKLEIGGVPVDAWPIEDTFDFRNGRVLPSSINRIVETTFFNVESIVLEVYSPELPRVGWENGFFEACEKRILDLQKFSFENPMPLVQLVRTYNLRKKLGWNLGKALKRYLKNELGGFSSQELDDLHEERYGVKTEGEIYTELIGLAE